ncbi:hypothetical protein IMZ08_00445 [Bacillus luteolus]|uniref:Uncharacterized protein n=1 Tax=Litchfieldia luteola TaxID=682179 RepID=A0ABR9QDI0_9BACI|nr:hypothetical protein [Cytobacillus luteolus]MBE4906523.1 hypothetical protein [Cytobacillus luteolus]MBP1941206.1 hypothetical protein [Cytobacillus luteolus]
MDHCFDLIGDAILMKPVSHSKLRLAIENLSTEAWFRDLYKNTQYTNVIWNDKNIKKILLNPRNVELIKTNQYHRNVFIKLVKKQYQ